MTKLIKLSEKNGTTLNNTKWQVGAINSLPFCKNPQLCTQDVFHAYKNINLAFLLNPIHAQFDAPLVWECTGEICVEDYGKVGCFSLEVTKKLKSPRWVGSKKEHLVRVAFAVLCAEAVLHIWEGYGDDTRVRNAIDAAKKYLISPTKNAAARAAAEAAEAAWAARAAAEAAEAAWAARAAAWAARAAEAAAWAARAARAAAWAARAAEAAAWADVEIDFCALANNAVELVYKA